MQVESTESTTKTTELILRRGGGGTSFSCSRIFIKRTVSRGPKTDFKFEANEETNRPTTSWLFQFPKNGNLPRVKNSIANSNEYVTLITPSNQDTTRQAHGGRFYFSRKPKGRPQYLLSLDPKVSVSSAPCTFTTVFGMGTGRTYLGIATGGHWFLRCIQIV